MPVVAAAAIGAGGSLLAANSASKANNKAIAATQNAADTAAAEQRRQFDIAQQNQQPWLVTGQNALNQLGNLYGISDQPGQTGTATGNLASFMASPDYQFRQNEQNRSLMARNSALGIQDSGAAQKAALQYSGNLASGEFNNYANRLSSLAGVGQTAANNSAQLGSNYANQVSNIAQNTGAALGSSYQNQGAINSGIFQNIAGIGAGLAGGYGTQWGRR